MMKLPNKRIQFVRAKERDAAVMITLHVEVEMLPENPVRDDSGRHKPARREVLSDNGSTFEPPVSPGDCATPPAFGHG